MAKHTLLAIRAASVSVKEAAHSTLSLAVQGAAQRRKLPTSVIARAREKSQGFRALQLTDGRPKINERVLDEGSIIGGGWKHNSF